MDEGFSLKDKTVLFKTAQGEFSGQVTAETRHGLFISETLGKNPTSGARSISEGAQFFHWGIITSSIKVMTIKVKET